MADDELDDDDIDRPPHAAEDHALWWRTVGEGELRQLLYWRWDPVQVSDDVPATKDEYDVDLDVLDSAVGRANPYAAPGGPDIDGVLTAITATFDRFDVAAAALSAYDPRVDGSGTDRRRRPRDARRIADRAAR